MSVRVVWPLAWAVSLASSGTAAAAPATASIHAVEGDVPLVYAPAAKGSPTSSFRLVFRVGSSSDPPGKGGLAHLVEHIVFQGTYDVPERDLWAGARAKGAVINAFTGLDFTIFTLDAPHDTFLPTVEMFLSVVTNPALRFADVDREKKVVDAEADQVDRRSIFNTVDMQLFPGEERGHSVIGTRRTRQAILTDDVFTFYEKHYVPSKASFVVVSSRGVEEIKALLDRGFLLPPDSAPRTADDEDDRPNVPSEVKIPSPVTLTASGYHLRGASVGLCREAAEFVELRLWEEVLLKDPVVSRVEVTCHRARGQLFILALGYTRTLLGSNLLTTIDEVFAKARKNPLTPQEKELVKKRAARALAKLRGDSEQLATELAVATALAGGDPKAAVAEVFYVPTFEPQALQRMMDRDFDEQGRITVHFSPFEQ